MSKKTAEQSTYDPSKRKYDIADDVLTTIQRRYDTDVSKDEEFQSKLNLTLNAFHNANFSAMIESSTDGINTLLQKQVDLLYFRSAAYYQVGQFSKAISDAQRMIQLAPTQALGYLRAGQLFSMNGNQEQAIKIYKTGLATTTGEHRPQLEYGVQQAEAKLQYRVDIITRAPYEVFLHILSYLCGYDPIKMLGVCKNWQKRLSDPTELWSTLVISINEPEWYHLDFIYHHVVNLDLDHAKLRICDKAMDQITLGKFCQLQSLTINKCTMLNDQNFFRALHAVSATLVELTISPKANDPVIEFKPIMAMCPQLKKFRYSHRYMERSPNFGSFPSNYVSSITNLNLDVPGLQELDIEETLDACPDLRSLCLVSGSPEALPLIRRYCVKLDTLWYRAPRRTHSFRPKNSTKAPAGIRNLCYSVMGNPHLMTVLKEFNETVEELALSLPGMLRHYPLDNIPPMKSLRSLNILHCHDPSMPGAGIVSKAPRLEHMALAMCNIRNPGIFESLQQLDYLKELEFIDVGTKILDGIHTFIHNLTAKGTIQKITFRKCKFLNDSLLSILPSIKSLLHITIFCDDEVHITAQGLIDFCTGLQIHPAISFLTLGNLDCITDSTLQILSALPHLTTLGLTLPARCTSRGLRYLSNKKVKLVTAT